MKISQNISLCIDAQVQIFDDLHCVSGKQFFMNITKIPSNCKNFAKCAK